MPEKPPLQLHGQAGEIPLWAEHQAKPRARRLLEHPTPCCPPWEQDEVRAPARALKCPKPPWV